VRGRNRAGFILLGLAVTALLAVIVSGFASGSPDGLERVAEEQGFSDDAEDHDLAGSPVADYGVQGVDDDRVSTGLAGLIGVTVTFAAGLGLFHLVRRRSDPDTSKT
jgi:cobalt/nickel transport system permease protein